MPIASPTWRSPHWVLVFALLTLGCVSLNHGYTYQKYRGRYLEVSKPSGSERLQLELNYDASIEVFINDYGQPDLLFVESRYLVYLIYLEQEYIAVFQRPTLSAISQVGIVDGISETVRQEIAKLPGWKSAHKEPQPDNEEPPESDPPSDRDTVSMGTSFVVDSKGLLLTSAHVVVGARAIGVKCPDQEFFPASLVTFDDRNDLAVLKTSIASGTPVLKLARAASVPLGTDVYTIGYPAPGLLGIKPKYSGGEISAHSGLQDDPSRLQVTIPIQPGNSGGPVVTKRGVVVGIIVAGAAIEPFFEATGALPENVNWAVKADYAFPLLSELNGTTRSQPTPEQVAKSVCLVVANQ